MNKINLEELRLKWKLSETDNMIKLIESNQDLKLFNAKKALYSNFEMTESIKEELLKQLNKTKKELEHKLTQRNTK